MNVNHPCYIMWLFYEYKSNHFETSLAKRYDNIINSNKQKIINNMLETFIVYILYIYKIMKNRLYWTDLIYETR